MYLLNRVLTNANLKRHFMREMEECKQDIGEQKFKFKYDAM